MRTAEPPFRVVTEPQDSSGCVTIEAHGTMSVRDATLLLRVIEFVTVERHRIATVDFSNVIRIEPDAAELLGREWPLDPAVPCKSRTSRR